MRHAATTDDKVRRTVGLSILGTEDRGPSPKRPRLSSDPTRPSCALLHQEAAQCLKGPGPPSAGPIKAPRTDLDDTDTMQPQNPESYNTALLLSAPASKVRDPTARHACTASRSLCSWCMHYALVQLFASQACVCCADICMQTMQQWQRPCSLLFIGHIAEHAEIHTNFCLGFTLPNQRVYDLTCAGREGSHAAAMASISCGHYAQRLLACFAVACTLLFQADHVQSARTVAAEPRILSSEVREDQRTVSTCLSASLYVRLSNQGPMNCSVIQHSNAVVWCPECEGDE